MDLQSIAIKVARSENLPVLPQIVSAVLKLADDPSTSQRVMEQVIERDLAISAKILRVANSSYYGLSQVESVGRAISVLGMNTVRSLVVNIAYQQMISGKVQCPEFSKIDFWLHSFATATAARILAKIKDPLRAEELYGAGMMHDVGLLVMDRFAPDELSSAILLAQEESIPLQTAEMRSFGFSHTVVGGLLASKWGLQGIIGDSIMFHHQPEKAPHESDFVWIIAAANTVAHRCGYRNGQSYDVQYDSLVLDQVGLPEAQYSIIENVVTQEVTRAQESFQLEAA